MAGIRWIPTAHDPHKMIAEATLQALRAVLTATRPSLPGVRDGTAVEPVTIRVEDHPILSEVGGVARVGRVAVARISRASFVAYEMDLAGLHELPVENDPAAGLLRVRRGRQV
jgi:hypothetical protein